MCEREVIISFMEGDATANVFSCSPVFTKKINTLAKQLGLSVTKHGYAVEMDVPKAFIKLVPSRQVSAAERKRKSMRMKAIRHASPVN